jgi:hypothetical protein
VELLGRFDKVLADEFDEFLRENDELRQRGMSQLVHRRNQIAHGLNEGVDTRKALQLKEVACDVADWFIAKLNPYR